MGYEKRASSRRSKKNQRRVQLVKEAADRCYQGNGYNPNVAPLPGLKVGSMETTFQHPYGVLPYGNIYTDDTNSNDLVRHLGLGVLSMFNDEQILAILAFLDGVGLAMVTACSRFLYVAAHQTELWRDLTLQLFNSESNGHVSLIDDFVQGMWKDLFVRTVTKNNYLRRQRGNDTNGSGHDSVKNLHTYLYNESPHRPIHVRGIFSDTFYRSYLCRSFAFDSTWWNTSSNNVSRENVSNLDTKSFLSKYEQPNIPVIIEDATKSWPALHKWTSDDYLIQKTTGSSYRATSGSAPYPAQFTMKSYFQYCNSTAARLDEAPLYLFDRSFAQQTPDLHQDYFSALQQSCPYLSSTHSSHGHDLFRLLGDDDRRPDYKWIIVGPQRSGSNFHIDPNATHAWNAPIRGRKFWILYPPGVTPPGVIPSVSGDEVTMPISVGEWFLSFWSHHVRQRFHPDKSKRPLECIVSPGELIFVPHGWWHLVYNLDEGISIALTHNYVSSTNLSTVLRFLSRKPTQISGCRDRSSAIPPNRLYEEFSNALKFNQPALWETAFPLSEQGWTCSAWTDEDTIDVRSTVNGIDELTKKDIADSEGSMSKRKDQKRKFLDMENSNGTNTTQSCGTSILSRAKSKLNEEEADVNTKPMFSFSFVQ